MTDHAAIARDQLRLAQQQLEHLDKSAETPAHQLLVFLTGAVVHAVHAVLADRDQFQQLVDEAAGYKPRPLNFGNPRPAEDETAEGCRHHPAPS